MFVVYVYILLIFVLHNVVFNVLSDNTITQEFALGVVAVWSKVLSAVPWHLWCDPH